MSGSLALKLKTTRKQQNLRQYEVAGFLKVSQNSLSRYEKNTRIPNLQILTNLAQYYQISIDWLLGKARHKYKKNHHWNGEFISEYKFPERLKEARENKNMSQSKLGRLLKIMPSNVTLYEQGKTEPSLENLVLIAEILGVTVDWLVGLED